jgi:endonuclease YncB( thermonuclease family)
MVLAAVLGLAGVLPAADRGTPGKWETLTGCRFLPEKYSDGDSFHIVYGQRERIFRLYFVDAPETDVSFPDRNREQCEHFGITAEQLKKAAEESKAFAAEWMSKPFVITTRWQTAMGRSALPRYYAMVEVSGKDLAELLVSHGWARAKGTVAVPPGGGKAGDQMEKLRKLEAQAKAKRLGIWAYSKPPVK